MKTKIHYWFVFLLSIFLLTTGCSSNPPLNTVVSAHGNMDWHVDTAQEFLFGTDMDGATSAANHCPDTWSRGHMHIGMTNTARYYHDKDKATPGDDADIVNGIDRTMLFFYAGHGSPESWDTLGDHATQSSMQLADWSIWDIANSGRLRYYWQCSCEVFAHGPRECEGYTGWFDYACPEDFDGSADSVDMRNVYERWGPALSKNLRLACGASTPAYCHEDQMNKIWNNYNNNGYGVADSFIDGLDFWDVVPLCIALGGSDVTTSPLYDATFTNERNTSGTSHYHIQFLTGFGSTPRFLIADIHVPELLPIIEVRPLPIPEKWRAKEMEKKEDAIMVTTDKVKDQPVRVKVDRTSGAIYVQGERKKTVAKEKMLKEADYIDRAMDLLKDLGLYEEHYAPPTGKQTMIESRPVKGEAKDIVRSLKGVSITLKRQIDIDGQKINVLGEGGTITVEMNHDGSIVNASKVWREIASKKDMVRVKSYDQAYEEAVKQIPESQAYKLQRWNFGYKEATGNVTQTELKIVFQFVFVPTDRKAIREFPPRIIEIPGQEE